MMIKILGTGCPNCLKLEANAKQACEELGIQADFVKVTQLEDITAYNIMRTPGLVLMRKSFLLVEF